MVEIVENWADVVGILIGILPAADHPGFVALSVQVEQVAQVEGFPTLVHPDDNNAISVLAREAQVADQTPNADAPIQLRVRAAGPPPLSYFVHPDWILMPRD